MRDHPYHNTAMLGKIVTESDLQISIDYYYSRICRQHQMLKKGEFNCYLLNVNLF